ncbi:MAG TPA: hypothetical protein DER23_01960 [Clostridiales bacterium]|nr:hypothetical protein [Clostridiales bacterium]
MSNNFEFERNNYSNKTNYDASYKNEKKDTITVNGLKINATYHSSSNPYVSGTITNNSNKTVEYIKVKVALKDSNGKVVNTVWTYAVGAEGLAPNESSEWKVYCTEATSISISLFE